MLLWGRGTVLPTPYLCIRAADAKFVLNNCRARSLIRLQCYLKSFIVYITNAAVYKKLM